jgi:hypothetical protein
MGETWPVKFSLTMRLPMSLYGSLTCRKAATWDRRLYFPSEGRHAEEFFAPKIRRLRPGLIPLTWLPKVSMLSTGQAFLKRWSSGSALVVLLD